MTPAPDDLGRAAGLDLLDRALAYTRTALVGVGPADLASDTPCAGWCLADLLVHLDDVLDAFGEAAFGEMALVPALRPAPPTLEALVGDLQVKACHLLGAWSGAGAAAPPAHVVVGGRPVPVGVVAHAAALEVALHGWDVGRATGRGDRLPEALAAALLPAARILVTPEDRPGRYAAPRPVSDPRTGSPAGGPAARLLDFTGRRPDWSTSRTSSEVPQPTRRSS